MGGTAFEETEASMLKAISGAFFWKIGAALHVARSVVARSLRQCEEGSPRIVNPCVTTFYSCGWLLKIGVQPFCRKLRAGSFMAHCPSWRKRAYLHFTFWAFVGSADVEVSTGRSQDIRRTLAGHSQDTHRTLEITEILASQRNEY